MHELLRLRVVADEVVEKHDDVVGGHQHVHPAGRLPLVVFLGQNHLI